MKHNSNPAILWPHSLGQVTIFPALYLQASGETSGEAALSPLYIMPCIFHNTPQQLRGQIAS